jgi:hypothetical protein
MIPLPGHTLGHCGIAVHKDVDSFGPWPSKDCITLWYVANREVEVPKHIPLSWSQRLQVSSFGR